LASNLIEPPLQESPPKRLKCYQTPADILKFKPGLVKFKIGLKEQPFLVLK
jgi:hypothetical protein